METAVPFGKLQDKRQALTLSSLFSRVRFPRLGLQARVKPRVQTNPALALHPGVVAEGGVSGGDRLAGGLRGVCH